MTDITQSNEVWVSTSKNGDYVQTTSCDEGVKFTRTDLAQAAVAAAYEAAARTVDTLGDSAATEALGTRLCCDGRMCGCQGADVGAYILHHIRALATPDQIAALAAERAATVTVNPLVWDNRGYEWAWWADTALGRGTYQIRCEGGIGYLVDFDGVTIGEPHDTLDAAKAAAQADYDARIRSAITITSGASHNHIPLPRAEVEALMAVRPLDLSNLLKHAFICGRVSAGAASSFHSSAWVEYDPTESAAYARILTTLQERMK